MKRLFRSRKERMLSGVLGGLAEYFGVDSALVRLIFVALLFLTAFFPLAIVYVIAAIIIPDEGRV